jgi:hypothetical protein
MGHHHGDCASTACMITAMLAELVRTLDNHPSADPEVAAAHRTATLYLNAFRVRGVLDRPCGPEAGSDQHAGQNGGVEQGAPISHWTASAPST